ncbi:MAG TPA: type II toxin-antitoxin system prevent-host-death family antitoxin [Patescibacteria group bacterium]|nr:type II toxin-antitoxin system prevent-host-death family antitoxin [Patescibacteria group bacterium]
MYNVIAISDARAKLPELVDEINEKFERAVITVNGQPKVVMLSLEELESLEETAEVLAIPHIKKDIKKSREQIKKGDFITLSDVK